MKRRFALNAVLLAAVVVLTALAVSIAIAQEGEVGKRLDRIAKKAKLRSYDGLWELSREIIDIGEDAADTLLEKLPNAGEKERLVYDAALYELREAGAATEDLMSLVGNDKADLTARLLAVDLIETKGMRTDVRKLFGNRAKYTEPLLRIAVCRAGYNKLKEVEASRLLREYVRSADYNTRAEAAVALAQIDDFDNSSE